MGFNSSTLFHIMGHTPETRKRAWEKIRTRRIKWFAENGPCAKCGSYDKLELDHIDPKEKEHHTVWSWSEERRAKELAKCQVLCETCHMVKTLEQRKPKGNIHGTPVMYIEGCRCDVCRAWKSAEMRVYHLSHPR